MLRTVWTRVKKWRRVAIGPLALVFRIERAVPVTGRLKNRAHAHAYQSFARRQSTSAARQVGTSSPGDRALLSGDGDKGLALVVGAGPGLGHSLARQLAEGGFEVVLASRNASKLRGLVTELREGGAKVAAYGCDATTESSVDHLFSLIGANHGSLSLAVYAVQGFSAGPLVDTGLADFEDAWRKNCLGAFLVSRAAARAMLRQGRGTIVFVGSTSSLLGRAGYLNLAVGKFGQRAISQVLARELWPKGIHVAHVVIDSDIRESGESSPESAQADPRDIADAIIALHGQPRTAWSSELDLRPWNERFWEHC